MVLYILTGYQVLGIVYLDQLSGARHTHISYHDRGNELTCFKDFLQQSKSLEPTLCKIEKLCYNIQVSAI